MVSSAEKDAATDKAQFQGVHTLTDNEKEALRQAAHDMTPTGRRAANITEGKPPDQCRW